MRKLLNFLVISILLQITVFSSVSAATFPDVSTDHDNSVAIEYLVNIGTLQGYPDGTFQPSTTINRAELMKVLVAGQGIVPDEETYKDCFPDIGNEWFAKYVCYAAEQEWVGGYPDGTFQPSKTVNKVEALKMLVNALGLDSELPETVTVNMFTDTDNSAWYAPYVYVTKDMGLLEVVSGIYQPAGEMNRAGVAEYIFRTLVVQELEAPEYTDVDRDEFLTIHELAELIPQGKAIISYVFYDGEVYQVESDEYAEITNDGKGDLDLTGYYIMGSKGEEKYTFPDLELAPGESVKVYTNQGDHSFESEDALWSNSGETVYLYDASGELIDNYSY
ncbi:hypothetical protein HN748_01260 [Candidatus Peregrinibacteria bacterium]|jgi:hypothetical protein|nr:hypothetical protein [Candidatus Peregrinibacteria bacterium]MBT7702839.1 hypothetical protein [Candidatus Peregrinibacteria bacterium]